MIVPTGIVRQAELAAGVAAVKQELAPDVVRIRYDIGPDWSDEWSIFFRIVLSDDASREDRLAEVTKRATSRLFDELKLAWIPTQGPPANRVDPDTGAAIRNCGQNLLCLVIDSTKD